MRPVTPAVLAMLLAAASATACRSAPETRPPAAVPAAAPVAPVRPTPAPAPAPTSSKEAAADLARVRTFASSGAAPATVAQAYEDLARRRPDTTQAAEALDEAGRAWLKARKPERAAQDFTELLSRYPTYPKAADARVRQGLALVEAGRPEQGMPNLLAAWEQVPTANRGNLALRIADAAEAAGNLPLSARWRSEAIPYLPPAERKTQSARVIEVAEKRLTAKEVETLAPQVPRDGVLGAALAVRIARSAPSGPGTLGVAVPLSGKYKAWGEAVVEGVRLALPEGGPVRIIEKDTRGEPDGAAAAIEQLAAEGAVAVVGGVTNAEAQRAAVAAQQAGIPLISLSRAEGVTDGRPFVFRLMLTARAQARALATLAVEQRGLRKAVVLYPEMSYGTELKGAFTSEVQARGGAVVRAVGFEPDRANFSPIVKDLVGKAKVDGRADWREAQKNIVKEIQDPYRRAKALEKARKELPPLIGFDVIFIPDFARTVTLLAPTLAAEDVVTTCDPAELARIQRASSWEVKPVLLLGGNGWDDPAIVEKAGRSVECAIFVDGFFAGSERPATRAFVDSFQRAHARAPSILEASAFDAASMVAAALGRGASGRKEMRQALATQAAFPGATGDVTFDGQGEPVRSLFLLTVDKGAIRELRPEEIPGAPATAP